MSESPFIETFPALSSIPGLVHGFFLRHPDIDVDCDREEALDRLAPFHGELLSSLGIAPEQRRGLTAEPALDGAPDAPDGGDRRHTEREAEDEDAKAAQPAPELAQREAERDGA